MLVIDHIDALGALLGDGALLTEATLVSSYESGARYDHGRAAFVARPSCLEVLSKVVGYCARHEITLVPQSGNTGLVGGSTPDESGSQGILSLDRMRSTFELDLENRSLRVDAGYRLSEINERLEPHGLFLPIDLGADPMAGGMAATNTGGARFLRFGDIRRNTLGLKVVLGDENGSVIDCGSNLRKDNTGPDWKHVFIGTGGAFGVIAECTFNLERLPRQTATAYLVPRCLEDAVVLLTEIEARAGTYLSAFEGMSGTVIRHALEHVPSLRNPFPGGNVPAYVILVELSRSWHPRAGEQPLESVLEAILAEVWDLPGAPLNDAFVGPPSQMWALRHSLSEGAKSAGYVVGLDLSFPRGMVMRFRQQVTAMLAQDFPQVEICDFGHIGDGGLHFNLVIAPGSGRAADLELAALVRERVTAIACEEYGGSFSAEHGLGRRNQHFHDRYTPSKLKQMAAQFKQTVSPAPLGSMRLG